MNSALLRTVAFPPPASRALVLAGRYGTRAGRAADACVSSRRQGMLRNVVPFEILLHLRRGPIGERTQFQSSVDHLGPRQRGPLLGLLAAQPDRPCIEAG